MSHQYVGNKGFQLNDAYLMTTSTIHLHASA